MHLVNSKEIQVIKSNKQLTFRVLGDCLTARDVYSVDIVAVDLTIPPKQHDIVLCYRRVGKVFLLMVKEYIGASGDKHQVTTRYSDRENEVFEVEEILGVVFACCMPDRLLRWACDLSILEAKGVA